MKNSTSRTGFTIVELLIVIVVIAILAAITIVAYNGIQDRAHNSKVQSELNRVHKLVQLYASENGSYPSTGGLNTTLTDANCNIPGTNRTANWVPDLAADISLPQSHTLPSGVSSRGGCYIYASDGTNYVVSAWNMVSGEPQTNTLYRRLGFREASLSSQFYICNHTNIGGASSGTYNINWDYYKHSYTLSNITGCNETPPNGA